jgi:thymidylate synthase
LWFIRGNTNNKILKEQGVHIWDANGSRQFLDSRGLQRFEEDELGPIYGYQWRHFNKQYIPNKQRELQGFKSLSGWRDDDWVKEDNGIDQLQQIIDQLKNPKTRTSRRLILTAWNPCQLDQMALPPCHILCQFNVHDGNKLSCSLYQRSVDTILGLPFNIASYSFLTHLIAKHCGLEAYEFVHFMGNCHLYENAIDAAKLQITREPLEFPTLSINQVRDNISDYQLDDFEIHNYKSHEAIKVNMIA